MKGSSREKSGLESNPDIEPVVTHAEVPAQEKALYAPQKEREHIALTEAQKDAVRAITLGIEEVDETIRSMAVEDVIRTLENGHPLNRIIPDKQGETIGYIACEDFVPREAYIKYFGTTGVSGRSLLKEIPAFLEYATQQGYTKLNFHGWNDRLNRVLERYGFTRVRTDGMAGFNVDFYEKTLAEQKSAKAVEQERITAFERKYINQISQKYQETLTTLGESRQEKERLINEAFSTLSKRLATQKDFEFGERQQAVLKLKLARHFQMEDSLDLNVLFDALIESPKFINVDKGSLNRLFEVHEQKTLQKIAEIRKQRAEMGHDEAFNPYEALFTTASGNYYMARLLNMPHLEAESAYMSHCVGTSDSYINQMKRGEIEILSFRHVPKINSRTQKLEGDVPIITIEYNLKTRTIEQMKKQNDEYLSPDDPYFADVMDALKQLRGTATDTGKPRDFAKINPSELGNIQVKDYNLLTERGEVSFRDFDPAIHGFVLKMGTMEVTPSISRKDVAKIVRIVEGIDCKPEEIAQKPEEVSESTKVYIGKLFPEFFQWLPSHIEHVYSSFPEGKVRRENIEIGGKDAEALEREMRERGINISSYAEYMLRSKEFATLGKAEQVNLIRLTVKDLGFSNYATTADLYKRAEDLGLELCPAEVGPQYRLQYEDQPLGEWIRIGMKQIADRGGDPHVFRLARVGDGLWLSGYWAGPAYEWGPGDEFVFRLRKKES